MSISPVGMIFCSYKTQEDVKHIGFSEVLRGA